MAKNRKRKRKQQNRGNLIRRPSSRIVDPVIDGEYVNESDSAGTNPITPNRQQRRTAIAAQAMSFQGPIPPPELLREYNEIVPNGADRIMKMAEAQSAHRIDLESTVVKGDNRRANWGLITGFAIGVLVLVLSFILINNGHGIEGTVLGTVDLVSLVGVFVYGKSEKRKELERRDQKNRQLTRR